MLTLLEKVFSVQQLKVLACTLRSPRPKNPSFRYSSDKDTSQAVSAPTKKPAVVQRHDVSTVSCDSRPKLSTGFAPQTPAYAAPHRAAQADQQASASFKVSITLHSSFKAMDAVQLCLEGRPLSLLATSSVRVDCPAGMNAKTASGLNTGKTNPGISSKPSEVVVTF